MISFSDVQKKFKGDKMPFWLLRDGSILGGSAIASNLEEKDLTKSWKLLKSNLDMIKTGAYVLVTSEDRANMDSGYSYKVYPSAELEQQEQHSRMMAEATNNGIEQFIYYHALGSNTHLRIKHSKGVKIVKLTDIDSFDINGEEVTVKGKGINQRYHIKDVNVCGVDALMEDLHYELPKPKLEAVQ